MEQNDKGTVNVNSVRHHDAPLEQKGAVFAGNAGKPGKRKKTHKRLRHFNFLPSSRIKHAVIVVVDFLYFA